MTVNKEGYKTILVGCAVAVAIAAAAWLLFRYAGLSVWVFRITAILGFALTAGLVCFFRDPSRPHAVDADLVFSAADGKVVAIEEVTEKEYFNDRRIQVSVFMSIANVHVNWYPVGGRVVFHKYHPGAHLVAWNPKSSEHNERTTTVIDTGRGEVMFRQIAGLLARRIVNRSEAGADVVQNTKFGIIKLGSRVDIFLPPGTEILAAVGDRVRGSQTPLARLPRE